MTQLIRTDERDGAGTLLRALSAIDGLDAVECRERDSTGSAYVLFRYGHSPHLRFVVDLELVGGGGELLARLEFPAAAAGRLAQALRAAGARHAREDS
ncbi:MAG: hypothetical protein QOH08_2577 [Chloroflexota bacterium]|jgi:hypothetical protein|nr:hypothetical protein [Chloroflexota bacterium]